MAARILEPRDAVSTPAIRGARPVATAEWRREVVDRLNELCSLPTGWDGYVAGPVSSATALFALRMLDAVCDTGTSPPSIVPGVSGDLQMEWHLVAGDIELHVRAPNDVAAWRLTADTGPDGEERILSTDFTEVAAWVASLLGLDNAAVVTSA